MSTGPVESSSSRFKFEDVSQPNNVKVKPGDSHDSNDVDVDWTSQHHTLGLDGNKAIPASILKSIAPIGQTITFAGPAAKIPKGYLLCNGASKLVADYAKLFAVIGYTYGGSGANFTLPTIANTYIRYSWGV